MHITPCTRCGFSRALSPPAAGLLSLPTSLFPKFLVPCKGRAGWSLRPRLWGGGDARLPGEPLREVHGARGRWSSHFALGSDRRPGGGRVRAVGGQRCGGELRGGAGRSGALMPCSRAAGSAGSGAPPTAAAGPRAPPSRCPAPGP